MFLDVLAQFLSLCPALSGRNIYVNYLAPKTGAVSLESVAADPIFRLYTDGGALYQTVFKLVLREPFDPAHNFSSFYSSFAAWVKSVNSSSSLPALSDGFNSVSLSIIKNGEVKNSSSTSSEFEILCRFVYSK